MQGNSSRLPVRQHQTRKNENSVSVYMGRCGNWVVQYSHSVGVPHPVSEWRRVNLIYLNVREPGVRTWISVDSSSVSLLADLI